MKRVLLWLLATMMVAIGILHFVVTDAFVRIVPSVLPLKAAIVYVSGVIEIALGAALIPTKTRRSAAWALVLLFIAVFPANINMAVNDISFGVVPPWLLWARLPLQGAFIAWAVWFTRPERSAEQGTSSLVAVSLV